MVDVALASRSMLCRGLVTGRREGFGLPGGVHEVVSEGQGQSWNMVIPHLCLGGRRHRGCREPDYQANTGSGGARGGASRGGSVGRARCVRIFRMTGPSVRNAINLRVPPQWGQSNTPISNTRRISSAHVERVGRIDRRASGVESRGVGARRGSVIELFFGPGTMRSSHAAAGARTP